MMKERINLERGAVNAAYDIIENGFEFYFNNGVKFGFFDETDNENNILENIFSILRDSGRNDIITQMLNNI